MTIRLRMALLTALVIALTTGFGSALIVWRVSSSIRSVVRDRIVGQAHQLGDMAGPDLQAGNLAGLNAMIAEAVDAVAPNIGVTDRRGVFVAHNEPGRVGDISPIALRALRRNAPIIGPIGETTTGAVRVLDRNGNEIGSVVLTTRTRVSQVSITRMYEVASSVSMLGALLGLFLGYLLAYYFVAPLSALLLAIRGVSDGRLESRVRPPRAPELREIGQAFNYMADALNRRVRNLEMLNIMGAEVSKARRQREIAKTVHSTGRTVLGVDVWLWVFDSYGEKLTRQPVDNVAERVVAEPNSQVLRAARQSRTVLIGPGEADLPPRTSITPSLPLVEAAAIIPLATPEGVVGVISAETADRRATLTPEQVAIAVAMANIVGPTVAALRRSESQARSSRMLQRILVPSPPQSVEGLDVAAWYQPAEEIGRIGGDYYDFVQMDENQWSFIIGDIAGKGLVASQYATMAKYVLRSYLLEYKSPQKAIELTNLALYNQMEASTFITLFCSIIDVSTGKFRYVAAGHPPALIGSVHTRVVRETVGGGPMVGIFDDAEFQESEDRLLAGNVMAMFTDGITEARRGRELYGADRLIHTLARSLDLTAEQIVNAIREDVQAFSGGRLTDDAAIVVVKRM